MNDRCTTTEAGREGKVANRFRFSLKSLVVAVSFVALLFGCWSDHRRLSKRIEQLENPPTLEAVISSGTMVAPIAPPGARRVGQNPNGQPKNSDVRVETAEATADEPR